MVTSRILLGENVASIIARYQLIGGELRVDTIAGGVGSYELALDGGLLRSNMIRIDVLNKGSIINPGVSVGRLVVTGNYEQQSGSTLTIEINNSTSYDSLGVSGSIKLAGVLRVENKGGYTFEELDEFDILDWGETVDVEGQFDSVILPSLSSYTLSSIKTSSVEMHVCPALLNPPNNADSTALLIFASWRMIIGSFPPSSNI